MKRRQFLFSSAATALVPQLGFGKPCPPSPMSATGGSTASTSCSAMTQQQDWVSRSSGAGVVWAHNFDTAAEVGAFRVVGGIGNDPPNTSNSTCVWDGNDGFAGGGSLNCFLPTGGFSSGYWNRPMAALRAGSNGRSVDDAAANSTITKRVYNSNSTTQDWDWRTGYYGHPDIQAANPTWAGQSGVWDGSEFWLQFRTKLSGTRWTPGNPSGKLMFIDVTGLTGSQEIVIQSENNTGAAGDKYYRTNPFRIYTSQGSEPNSLLTSPQGTGDKVQPGSPWDATCRVGQFNAANKCWEWPADEWVTILVHVIPGRDNASFYAANYTLPLASWPYHDMTIEIWLANSGATAYTKIYENFSLAWDYYSSGRHPAAFNKIGPTAYMNAGANAQPAPAGWSQKFTQIIFSKQFIPCPSV